MRRLAPDRPGLLFVVAAGLAVASLFAPWARATEGLDFLALSFSSDDHARASGWEWLTGGRDVAIAAFAALLLALAAGRAAVGEVRTPLLAATAAAGCAVVLIVLIGGVDERIVTKTQYRVDPAIERGLPSGNVTFGVSWGEGPLIALSAMTLAFVGVALALRPVRGALPLGKVVLLVAAAAAVVVSTFMRWTWLGIAPVDAWGLYRWADTGLVLVATFAALSVALPRPRMWLVVPLIALALPFIEMSGSGDPAGFNDGRGTGNAVGPGALVAGAALAVAGIVLAWRPRTRRAPAAAAGKCPGLRT